MACISYFFIAETTTFSIFLLKVAPTPIGFKPEFLGRKISGHTNKASLLVGVHFSEHMFWVTLVNAEQKIIRWLTKPFERYFFPPISTHTWRSWSSLCFHSCFPNTFSWYAFQLYWMNFLWCVCKKNSFLCGLHFGCLYFNKSKVSLLIGKIR